MKNQRPVGIILYTSVNSNNTRSRWKDKVTVAIRSEELAISIDKWAGPLTSWLRRRCANPDDIVQEAFCRLAQQTRPPERTAPWLFSVALNLVREEARRTKRRQQRESVVARTENHNASASQSLEDAELRNAVDTLSEELREIVIARVWGELTLAGRTSKSRALFRLTCHAIGVQLWTLSKQSHSPFVPRFHLYRYYAHRHDAFELKKLLAIGR